MNKKVEAYLAGEKEVLVYSVEEVADLLGVSRASVYKAVQHKDIPSIKLGARYLIPKEMFAKFLGGEYL